LPDRLARSIHEERVGERSPGLRVASLDADHGEARTLLIATGSALPRSRDIISEKHIRDGCGAGAAGRQLAVPKDDRMADRRVQMTRKTKNQANKAQLDAALDEALEETFPASDPPQMTEPAAKDRAISKRSARRRADKKSPAK
jgi:hypothetical protein